MSQIWKQNWDHTQQHFKDWWNHKGLVVGAWGPGLVSQTAKHAAVEKPAPPATDELQQTDIDYIPAFQRWKMAHRVWPLDIVPACWPHVGTLPLAQMLGAKPRYAPNNVWYRPSMTDIENHAPLKLDPEHPEVKRLETILRGTVQQAKGNYLVAMPALLGGIDILAEVRGTADMLIEMMEKPEAVHRRLKEIQEAYEIAFDRMYEIVKQPDGSMSQIYFMLWGPGKTGLCQCDSAVLLSPEMFPEFVIPYLRQQCKFLDYSMFHIDGSPALEYLDHLIDVEDLTAIEYTPDPKVPNGGDPCWYDTYRKILKSGKSLWAANLKPPEIVPLLDAIGPKGVYVSFSYLTEAEAEKVAKDIEPFRKQVG